MPTMAGYSAFHYNINEYDEYDKNSFANVTFYMSEPKRYSAAATTVEIIAVLITIAQICL